MSLAADDSTEVGLPTEPGSDVGLAAKGRTVVVQEARRRGVARGHLSAGGRTAQGLANAAAVVLLAAALPAAVTPAPPSPIAPPPAAAVWLPRLAPPSGLLKPTLDVLLKFAFS